jgi:CRISPR system Cascade subunit CasA
VLLTPDSAGENVVDATLTWSRREKSPPVTDPYLIYQVSKAGDPYPRPASLERALWRDVDALLLADVGEEHRSRPDVLGALEYAPEEFVAEIRVRVFGFDQDGQARDKQTFIQQTPPVLRWLETRDPAYVAWISAVRGVGEQIGGNLWNAVRLAWSHLADANDDGLSPPKRDASVGPWPAAAESRYWPQAERLFWQLVTSEANTVARGDVAEAAEAFARLAEAIYDDIDRQVSSGAHWRMTRALARHRYRIRWGTAAARTRESAV